MEVKIVENYQEMSRLTAILLAAEVIENPHTILGLATGSTPVGLYKELITMYQNGKLDFSDVKTFNLDEYVGLAAEHEQSYHYFMKKNLFEHINMKEENIHIPRGDAADISEEALRYEQEIQKTGKIQLQLLGLGENGHIGFNEPADSFSVQTGEIVLADSTIEANQRFFESALSRQAITIQSTPGAHGHFTPYDAWDDSGLKLKEINLGAESLHRPVPNIIATLMHEMIHYWCHSQGIKDTSRGNTYHNNLF